MGANHSEERCQLLLPCDATNSHTMRACLGVTKIEETPRHVSQGMPNATEIGVNCVLLVWSMQGGGGAWGGVVGGHIV